jgi:hypothetical protein
LVKGRCTLKHGNHVSRTLNIPRTNVLVKGRGTRKHFSRVCDPPNIPRTNVLVKGRCTRKHTNHKLHLRNIPRANDLVKGRCTKKHSTMFETFETSQQFKDSLKAVFLKAPVMSVTCETSQQLTGEPYGEAVASVK